MTFVVFFGCIGSGSFGVGPSTHTDLGRVDHLIDKVADQLVDDYIGRPGRLAVNVGAGRGARTRICRIFGIAIVCICLCGLSAWWGVGRQAGH